MKSLIKSFLNRIRLLFRNLFGEIQKLYVSFLNLFSDTYYQTRLFKPRISLFGYLFTALILFVLIPILPTNFFESFGYINFTEQNPVVLTVLLTVLLSAGFVFLGDDTKGWTLARITIIRDVVMLKGLLIAVLVICLLSLLPDLTYFGKSLKELSFPILFCAYLFIIEIFIRVYRWLSDLAADPRLFNTDNDDESRIFPSSSYRFARIVYLIRHNNRRDVWQSILERRIPDGYEEFIHEEFFKAVNEMVSSKNSTKLQELSLMLEIYEKYFNLRNLNSWRFELEYIRNFLSLYHSVRTITHLDRPHDIKIAGLWRGEAALERIINQLTSSMMNGSKVYSLFDAMNSYVSDSKLIHPSKRRENSSKVLDNFFESLFEALFNKNKLDAYDIQSWVDQKENWQVTYSSIYESKNNVTIQLLKHFEDWLFAKLDQNKPQTNGKPVYLLEIDRMIELFFPEVDPMDFSRLYWFMYNAKNTTDTDLIAKLILESHRPFGHTSFSGFEYVSTGEDFDEKYRQQQKVRYEESIKLFAHTHAGYFTSGFGKIDEIIASATQLKSKKDIKDEDKTLDILIEDLKMIKRELNL